PMFNLETERMAERFRAKRRKAIEEREKAEKEKQEIEKANGNPVNGDSAMVISSPKEGASHEDRSTLKRARDDEMQDSDGPHPPKRIKMSPFGTDEGGNAKNVRFTEQDDTLELPAIALNGDTINDTIMSDHLDPPSPSPIAKPLTDDAPSSTKVADTAPIGLTQQVIHAPSRTPSPGVSTPPTFNVTSSLFSALEETLATKTANLNVEQLEALRASCLNVVWAHRGDWDRDNLMMRINDAITKYLVDMGEISEDED
ncbi:2184_t:CDS:1, partial [Acaulospora colombiana]